MSLNTIKVDIFDSTNIDRFRLFSIRGNSFSKTLHSAIATKQMGYHMLVESIFSEVSFAGKQIEFAFWYEWEEKSFSWAIRTIALDHRGGEIKLYLIPDFSAVTTSKMLGHIGYMWIIKCFLERMHKK